MNVGHAVSLGYFHLFRPISNLRPELADFGETETRETFTSFHNCLSARVQITKSQLKSVIQQRCAENSKAQNYKHEPVTPVWFRQKFFRLVSSGQQVICAVLASSITAGLSGLVWFSLVYWSGPSDSNPSVCACVSAATKSVSGYLKNIRNDRWQTKRAQIPITLNQFNFWQEVKPQITSLSTTSERDSDKD